MLFTRQSTPKMKKLFSKIETKIDNTSKEPNSYVGKAFTVGRMTVTVEEVLAEGKYFFLFYPNNTNLCFRTHLIKLLYVVVL